MPVDQPLRKPVENSNESNKNANGSATQAPSSSNGMSFMGGFKTSASSSNMDSGMLDFDSFGQTKKVEPAKESSGMSFMGGFKSTMSSGTPNGADSGLLDFDNFGTKKSETSNANGEPPKAMGMSLMGGFKSVESDGKVDSGMLDFDSFSQPKKASDTSSANVGTLPATKSPGMGMSLMGGFKTVSASSNIDSGMLDFDSFGSMGQKPKAAPVKLAARDIFSDFGPPADDGLGTYSMPTNGSEGSDSSDDMTINDDKVRGTEELLNDYITTLVVQLLTVSCLVHLSNMLNHAAPRCSNKSLQPMTIANGIGIEDCFVEARATCNTSVQGIRGKHQVWMGQALGTRQRVQCRHGAGLDLQVHRDRHLASLFPLAKYDHEHWITALGHCFPLLRVLLLHGGHRSD